MSIEATSIAKRVDEIFVDCLYREEEMTDLVDGEVPVGAVIVEGITNRFGFNPDRLHRYKEEIREILNMMPDEFHTGEGKGGGMSFLNLCMTKDGHQWGEHRNMEQLICLAIGLDMGKYCMPRMMWGMFPGGMPYVTFTTEES